MRRDESGKFISKNEENAYGFYSKLLNKPFDTLKELKEAEAVAIEEQNAKLAEKEARQADVAAVQNAAQNYLNLVAENNAKRAELKNAEDEAYAAYKAQLDDFAQKHNGYHLTYVQDGANIEFKIEENRQQTLADILEEQRKAMQKFFNGFCGF